MKQPALIVIDMLNDFLQRWSPAEKQRLLGATNALVRLMRSRQRPVIWVRQEFRPDLQDALPEMRAKGIRITIAGTPGCQIAADLAVDPSDTVIIKKRYSAFYGTTLDQVLADLKPDGLILAGINTHACIRVAAIDAYQRDWQVILAADCVGSYDQEHHEISLRYMKDKIASVMSNEEIQNIRAGLELPGEEVFRRIGLRQRDLALRDGRPSCVGARGQKVVMPNAGQSPGGFRRPDPPMRLRLRCRACRPRPPKRVSLRELRANSRRKRLASIFGINSTSTVSGT
jgi:nicotinamidase-related amidase